MNEEHKIPEWAKVEGWVYTKPTMKGYSSWVWECVQTEFNTELREDTITVYADGLTVGPEIDRKFPTPEDGIYFCQCYIAGKILPTPREQVQENEIEKLKAEVKRLKDQISPPRREID